MPPARFAFLVSPEDGVTVIPNGVDTEYFRRLGLTASDRLALLRGWLVDDPHGRDESGHFEERAAEAHGLIHCSRLLCQQVAGLHESLTGSESSWRLADRWRRSEGPPCRASSTLTELLQAPSAGLSR
jgi:hypothetical protein